MWTAFIYTLSLSPSRHTGNVYHVSGRNDNSELPVDQGRSVAWTAADQGRQMSKRKGRWGTDGARWNVTARCTIVIGVETGPFFFSSQCYRYYWLGGPRFFFLVKKKVKVHMVLDEMLSQIVTADHSKPQHHCGWDREEISLPGRLTRAISFFLPER